MVQVMGKRFLTLILTVILLAGLNAQTVNYKKLLKSKKLIISKKYSTTGAVKIVDDKGMKAPGVLRMTNKGVDERYIGFNFRVPSKIVSSMKNKAMRFRIYVKKISGNAKLSFRMRAFKNNGKSWRFIMDSPLVYFKGKKGEWTLMELRFRIPPNDEIDIVDFQTGFRPASASDVVEYLIDEPLLEAVEEKAQTTIASQLMSYVSQKNPGELPIIKNGKASAVIVTEKNPSVCVKYAVEELNKHIELCTGARLPVITDAEKYKGNTIHIGKTKLTERFCVSPDSLPPDNWIIRKVGNALLISGGDNKSNLNPVSRAAVPFGTLYGVYEFLERFMKVRWYWPGSLGTVAPLKKNLILNDINLRGAPSYQTRFCFYAVPKDPDISKDETWKWWRRQRWGGIGGSPIGMHSFNSWPKRFAKTHPEYFAIQTDGKAMTKAHSEGSGHVCMSNPEVLKQTVQDKINYFQKYKWARYSPVMPGDSNGLFYCRGAKCQSKVGGRSASGTYSNAVWSYVNKVAAEVQKNSPGRFITCCAYSGYRDVPDFPLLPNVAVTLCFGGSGLPNNIYKPEGKKEYVAIISSWEKTGANLYAWDYWDSPRRKKGTNGAPAIFPHAIKEYFLLDYGRVKGHVIELCEIDSNGVAGHNWADWIYDSLNVYVGMRLLWDINANVDNILNEFYTEFYGPAAPWIKKFYTQMEQAYANPNTKGGPDFKWYWETVWVKTYPADFVKKVMGHLREAVKATKGKEPYHARAKKTLQGFIPFERISRKFSGIKGDNEKKLTVPPAGKAPVIDGKANDKCWGNSIKTRKFIDSFKMYDLKSNTEAKLCFDDKNLYILFKAGFPLGSKLKLDLPSGSRDRFVWTDESCELFLIQGNKKYQFLISPNNALLDLFQVDIRKKYNLNETLKWNCAGIKYDTKINKDNWTAEVAIPFESLDLIKPSKDNPWKINFTRNYYYRKGSSQWQCELSCWSPTFGSFHNVNYFGTLYLK